MAFQVSSAPREDATRGRQEKFRVGGVDGLGAATSVITPLWWRRYSQPEEELLSKVITHPAFSRLLCTTRITFKEAPDTYR
jgi:hypothetical protein